MAAFVGHTLDAYQTVLLRVFVELCARERVTERNLNGLDVQLLGEINALAQSLARFARQADDEIAMNHQPQLVGTFR